MCGDVSVLGKMRVCPVTRKKQVAAKQKAVLVITASSLSALEVIQENRINKNRPACVMSDRS